MQFDEGYKRCSKMGQSENKIVCSDETMPLLIRRQQMTIPIDDQFYEKIAKMVFMGVDTKIDFVEKEKGKEMEMETKIDISGDRV